MSGCEKTAFPPQQAAFMHLSIQTGKDLNVTSASLLPFTEPLGLRGMSNMGQTFSLQHLLCLDGQYSIAGEHHVTTSAAAGVDVGVVFLFAGRKAKLCPHSETGEALSSSRKATMVLSPMPEPEGPASPKISPASPLFFSLQEEQKLIAQRLSPPFRSHAAYALVPHPFGGKTKFCLRSCEMSSFAQTCACPVPTQAATLRKPQG